MDFGTMTSQNPPRPSGTPAARKAGGNGRRTPSPVRLPIGSFYARTDKRGRRYLSGRLGLMKLMLFETEVISEGDRVWEAVLVEGPHVTDNQRAVAAQIEEVTP
jgi:hypothetical protein